MKIHTELFGGKYDGKPIEVDRHVKEVLVPDVSVDIDYELEFGDPTQPFEMKTVSYKIDNNGKYSNLGRN